MPPDTSAASAFEAAKAWMLPRVGSAFRLSARSLLPPELLTAVMVGIVVWAILTWILKLKLNWSCSQNALWPLAMSCN